MKKIAPCLWFDAEAEDAAKVYCSIFKDSKVSSVSRHTEAGKTAMTTKFERGYLS